MVNKATSEAYRLSVQLKLLLGWIIEVFDSAVSSSISLIGSVGRFLQLPDYLIIYRRDFKNISGSIKRKSADFNGRRNSLYGWGLVLNAT